MTDESIKPDSNTEDNITAKANLFWIAALVSLTLASIYALTENIGGSRWTGSLLFFLALMLFWSMEEDAGAPQTWVRIFKRLASASNAALIIAAISCSAAAAWIGHYLEGQPNPLLADITMPLWLMSGLIIFLMYAHISFLSVHEWWRNYQREIVGVALMTLAAAALRFYQLGTLPNIITADGGWIGMAALKLLPVDSSLYAPFSFYEGFGRPYLDVVAAAIDLFGRNKFGLRFLPALGGSLAIPATYIFARRLLGVRNAVIAALLLMVSHTHIHFSRTSAVGFQQATWLAPLELYCLLKGLEERKRVWIVVAGLLLGFDFNVYLNAQVFILMILVFLGMVAIIKPLQDTPDQQTTPYVQFSLRENLHNLLWFFGSILLSIFPSLVWIYYHPTSFGARWATEGLFQSGWLDAQITTTGQPLLIILWERVIHVCMSIFILPFQNFYWAPVPILDLITANLFIVGVFMAFRRVRNPRILLLNSWFWFGVLAIAIFTIPPEADSYRLLMILPAIYILAALGWAHITSLAERLAQANWRMVASWSVILIVLVTALNLKTYFIDFSRSCAYGGPNTGDRVASLLGEYLHDQPAFNQAYLLGDENFSYGNYPSLDYLSGSLPIINISKPFIPPDTHGSTIFIMVPSREPERVAVSQFAPDGQSTRISDCGRLAFLAYRIYIP
jgi:predicted membrane-bound mannosyltransferase